MMTRKWLPEEEMEVMMMATEFEKEMEQGNAEAEENNGLGFR